MMWKTILPKTVVGNYWITDKSGDREQRLINIEAKNGKWEITSNNDVKVIVGSWKQTADYELKANNPDDEIIDKITLTEYSMHYICIGKANDLFILYCSPVYEENFTHLDIRETKEILIGKSSNSNISYKTVLVEQTHAKLFFAGGSWMIENYDKKYGTFVNNKQISREVLQNRRCSIYNGIKNYYDGK